MCLYLRPCQGLWSREVMEWLALDRPNIGTIVNTQLVHHLADSRDVVVTAANEGDQSFPCVLVEDTDSCECRSTAGKVGI